MTRATPPADSPAVQLRIALRGSGDELECLAAIDVVRAYLALEEQHIAFKMRLRGGTWRDIGAAFGVSAACAQQAFSDSAGLLERAVVRRAFNGAPALDVGVGGPGGG